jgi:hypothetical protein
MKEEGGGAISPQAVGGIEHDRRSPRSGHLILQFSGLLKRSQEGLFSRPVLLPDEVRADAADPEGVATAFARIRHASKE